jgi:hypothetical protein
MSLSELRVQDVACCVQCVLCAKVVGHVENTALYVASIVVETSARPHTVFLGIERFSFVVVVVSVHQPLAHAGRRARGIPEVEGPGHRSEL